MSNSLDPVTNQYHYLFTYYGTKSNHLEARGRFCRSFRNVVLPNLLTQGAQRRYRRITVRGDISKIIGASGTSPQHHGVSRVKYRLALDEGSSCASVPLDLHQPDSHHTNTPLSLHPLFRCPSPKEDPSYRYHIIYLYCTLPSDHKPHQVER